MILAGCPRPAHRLPNPPETPTPLPTPSSPVPAPYVPNKRLDTGKLFNGMQYRVAVETDHGTTATTERSTPASYALELQVKVKVPKPHKQLSELARLNESLPAILPALPALLETAKISPHFDNLYRLKVATLQQDLHRLDNLLSRHNFYDCETFLELQHPETRRRVLLIQSDMDVDGDGSDSDRVPEVDGSSATFQPFTSYRWPKKTGTQNSFIPPREAKLKSYDQELAAAGITPARTRELKEAQARLRSEIAEMKKYSYLVAATDPYVVLPGSMFGTAKTPYSPMIGDYCAVVFGNVLYPAVVGDAGPTYKAGECSLRLCRQISPQAALNNRPIADLKVTYLVFPGTAERPMDVPDLEKWRAQCAKLLAEIGGHRGELFAWENLIKPKPPATPSPATPAPASETSAPATPLPSSP